MTPAAPEQGGGRQVGRGWTPKLTTCRDWRDTLISDLAMLELSKEERIADLVADRDAYKAITVEALQQLGAITRKLERLQASHRRTLDEYRSLRERVLREADRPCTTYRRAA